MDGANFEALLGAVDEAMAHARGERHDLRTTVLPAAPAPMSAAEVRRLRERVGASQAVFAHALNVSPRTVQAWETGARVPDGGNLRLLRVAEAHPDIVFDFLPIPRGAGAD